MLYVIEFSIHAIKISLNSIEIKKNNNFFLIYACAIENHLETILQYLYTSCHYSINKYFFIKSCMLLESVACNL